MVEDEGGPLARETATTGPLDHEPLPPVEPPPPGRRVFVNRNLRFGEIEAVGFDMDYTLAPYAKRELEELSYEMTKARMVEELGYPKSILPLPYDPGFAVRGLAIDKRLGNILLIDRHGYVARAHHGRRPLDRQERHAAYRNVKVRLSAARYHWVDTLFALPEVALYASVVDLYELELGVERIAYGKLFDDIRNSIDACHRDGSLKVELMKDLGRYLIRDPDLSATLRALRAADKRLFVVTNSEAHYTDAVMRHLLDGRHPEHESWRSYFDLVVVEAKKPAFFTEHLPFHEVDVRTMTSSTAAAERLQDGCIYAGGSIRELARVRPDLRGEHVLYVGDHIYGDIIRSKRDTLWRTALVIEELEEELTLQGQTYGVRSELEGIDEHVELLSEQIRMMETRRPSQEPRTARQDDLQLQSRRHALEALVAQRQHLASRIAEGYNPHWGSVFRAGNELSRFGRQVEEYACIYTSRVTNLLRYAPSHYFRSPRHWLPHEKS